jgi:hypothetical protein
VNTASERIHVLHREAFAIAYKEVERIARKIMKRNPKGFNCFCMGMGSWSFHSGTGVEGVIDNNDPRCKEMDDFMCEWADTLKITGMPLRLDRWDSPLLTDW